MNNKESYTRLFSNGLYYYDELTDSIYYYPCNDLHGMFGGGDCNCTTHSVRKYLSQDYINKRIANYEQSQQANANLYAVTIEMNGYTNVKLCDTIYAIDENTVYHLGSGDNYTKYCTKDNIEKVKKELQKLCIEKFDERIEQAKKAKQYFIKRINKEDNN